MGNGWRSTLEAHTETPLPLAYGRRMGILSSGMQRPGTLSNGRKAHITRTIRQLERPHGPCTSGVAHGKTQRARQHPDNEKARKQQGRNEHETPLPADVSLHITRLAVSRLLRSWRFTSRLLLLFLSTRESRRGYLTLTTGSVEYRRRKTEQIP